MIRFFFLVLFSGALLLLPVGFKRLTKGFKLAKTHLAMPERSDWKRDQTRVEGDVGEILRQPFYYLDKGSQCYVFGSRDGQYVIKLFRFDQRGFSLFKKKKKGQREQGALDQKIERFSSASLLALDRAREETGLVYLHLNLTERQLPVLCVKGPIGQTCHLALDQYRFAIQKRVDSFRQALLAAHRSGNREEMAARIDSFVSLLEKRVDKKIGNFDSNLSRNFGFWGKQAIELDFGNYYSYSGSRIKEIRRYTNRFKSWLFKNAPEWVPYLETRVQACEDTTSSPSL